MPKGIIGHISRKEWAAQGLRHELARERELLKELLPAPNGDFAPSLLYPGSGKGGVIKEMGLDRMAIYGFDLNGSHCLDTVDLMPTAQADILAMPFGDDSFDIVFFDRTLHHLVTQGILEKAISEAARVLKPGGLLLAFEPNLWNPIGFGIEAARRIGLVTALRGRDDDVPLSPTQVRELFHRYGCSYRHLPGTFVWRRLPPAAQRVIVAAEPFLLRNFPDFARVLMFVGTKRRAAGQAKG